LVDEDQLHSDMVGHIIKDQTNILLT